MKAMASEPADIMLCDIRMPEHDGLWLAKEVRTHWPHTAIIMTTGTQDADVVQASRRLGALAYITKPFVSVQLREAVDAAALQCMRTARPDGGPGRTVRPGR